MASKPKPEAPKAAAPKPGAIGVTGPKQGRWRAGRHFSRDEKTIPLSELTDDELQAIHGDPVLTVRAVD